MGALRTYVVTRTVEVRVTTDAPLEEAARVGAHFIATGQQPPGMPPMGATGSATLSEPVVVAVDARLEDAASYRTIAEQRAEMGMMPLVDPGVVDGLVKRFGIPRPRTDRELAEAQDADKRLEEAEERRRAGEKPDNGRIVRFLCAPHQQALFEAAGLADGEFMTHDAGAGLFTRMADGRVGLKGGVVQVNTDAVCWEYC